MAGYNNGECCRTCIGAIRGSEGVSKRKKTRQSDRGQFKKESDVQE